MQIIEKKEIKAVHMTDLADLLKKFDQLEDFTNGNIKCEICSDILINTNIGSLKLKNERLIFSCNKPACFNKMVKKSTD
ncbi:MAG: hypothetical protein HW410_1546 [Nitrosarchaeum sp.]|nr:hypothetical protein [Nitrosarchaeum sp.]